MIDLVLYDIHHDRLRTKLGDKLLELGLERIQLSVYMGQAPTLALAEVLDTYSKKIAETDRIYHLKLGSQQVKDMKCWGQEPAREMILGGISALLV